MNIRAEKRRAKLRQSQEKKSVLGTVRGKEVKRPNAIAGKGVGEKTGNRFERQKGQSKREERGAKGVNRTPMALDGRYGRGS